MALYQFLFLVVGVTGICKASLQACNSETRIRLQGGASNRHGRLEVCRTGFWQTICEQHFGSVDATVVCRQLGFSDQGAKRLTSGFIDGSSNQWKVNIMCNGTEESIFECPTKSLARPELCQSPITNIGIECQIPKEGELRILGGHSISAGRLEVYNQGWGTVCDDYWSRNDAQVACRQLGFSASGARSVRTGFRKHNLNATNIPIILDNLQCTGSEKRLIDCKHNGLRVHNCEHKEDAGIVCKKNSTEKMSASLLEFLQSVLLEN